VVAEHYSLASRYTVLSAHCLISVLCVTSVYNNNNNTLYVASPGQLSVGVLQFLTSSLDPGQREWFAEDLHDLIRTWEPSPQLTLHCDHWLHSDQPLSHHNTIKYT